MIINYLKNKFFIFFNSVEVVYALIQEHAVLLEAQFIQENAQVIQIVLNAVIISLVDQMMEKTENVYFLVNAVELVSVENALEEMILNAALVPEVLLMEVHLKINSLDHAQAVVELVLILKLFLAKRVLFLVNVQEEVMLNVALLDLDLHGI